MKCIYIDPPYNTGNENWVYNDNVNSPMLKEWLGKVVDKDDLTRHEKWLCMMMPRLKLLRELLAEDGVIFVSIDDNEQHRLRMLMDEVFGEENFVACFVWQKRYSRENRESIGDVHEFVFLYALASEDFKKVRNKISLTKDQEKVYKNPDNNPRGPWRLIPMTAQGYRPNQMYEIISPTGKKFFPPEGRCWSMIESEFLKLKEMGRISFGKDGNSQPNTIRFLDEVDGVVPWTWWPHEEVGHTDEAKKQIREYLGESSLFDNPKPTRLLHRILEIATNKDSIILDSFAGSGTTAHAVMQLNKEDGGNRKFILIECEDYADTITAERVRRVIKKLTTESAETTESKKKKKGSSTESSSVHSVTSVVQPTFSYFELGKPINMQAILNGKNMPTYAELARYVFYTATGEEFDESKIDEKKHYIGKTNKWDVYLFYKPDIEYLKRTALNLEDLEKLGKNHKKRRLIFAPTKYVEQDWLDEYGVDFSQLPFEIYRFAESK